MYSQKAQNLSFYMLLGAFGIGAALIFLPFFKIIALAGILSVLFFPLKLRILKRVKSETAASMLTLLLALVIIFLPLYAIGQLAFNEIYDLYSRRASIAFSPEAVVNSLPDALRGVAQDLLSNAGEKFSGFAGNIFNSITALATNLAGFVVDFVLTAFTFYYFLRDGEKFKNFLEHVFPLSEKHGALLRKKLEAAVKGVVQGSFLVALIQGTVATIGFFIFGVPAAFLWGAFTVLAALVPNFGTSLSLVPAVLYLFITGHTGAGIGMSIWSLAAVGTVDNIVGPQLVGARAQLHPILVLFSVLGGLALFGLLGFLIGPILMAIFVALIDIFRDPDRE